MKTLFTTLLLMALSQSVHAAMLEYEIFSIADDGNATTIAAGKKEYSVNDVSVEQMAGDGESFARKSVSLEDGFVVGASIYREQQLDGFGMWAENDAPKSFSWEWFTYEKLGVYKKLQEGGVVAVKYKGMPLVQEIAEIYFVTDISFRINNSDDPGSVDYRVNIKEGSVLKFAP